MALIYVFSASLIIVSNIDKIPESFNLILSMAFNPPATIAGTAVGEFIDHALGHKTRIIFK